MDREGDQAHLRQSSGGLVSAIKSYFENGAATKEDITEKYWIGVADFGQADWEQVKEKQSDADFTILPLFADKQLYTDYYNGFSNSVLWPLFHYFPSVVEYQTHYFDAYVQMNKFFAESILPILQPGDTIWIHDYQLMLLPHLLRTRRPEASIGFFLHIPFPSYEIFRLLPSEWKKTLLHGVMGADIVGFHTHDYVQHFIQSAKMILGVDNYFHNLQYQDRLVKAELFPIGLDYRKFNQAAYDPEVLELRNGIGKNFEEKKIIFSVDRLDYTKGLMDRLNGYEVFLDKYPEWQDKVVFILNIVPSRDEIQAYNDRKRQIEEKIGTLNGKFSSISWQPVIYRYNHIPFKELCALYQAADVALITPLRDGMNLVAKEYVASCATQKGVLVLSELAGAASELSEALLVNPTDVIDVATAIARALTMPLYEQRRRMALMQKRLIEYDVSRWVNDFLDQLTAVKREQKKQRVKLLDETSLQQVRRHYKRAHNRCLLLDYDGTLAPLSRTPSEAVPGDELKEMLRELSMDAANNVAVISGRESATLEKWFGDLSLILVAEHGASVKMRDGDWQQLVTISGEWKDQIRPIMQMFVTRCAGSFIEEKSNTIAWHYRNTHPDLGFSRSRELLNALSQLMQNTMLQAIDGNKVVEVRMAGFDKGVITKRIIDELHPDFVLSMGDDTTDEDMFKALEGQAYTVKVGHGATVAQYTVLSQQQVLPLLNKLMQPLEEKKLMES